MGEWPVIFSPAQARVAAERGVRIPTCVDAVLADAEARAEIIERLA
jgi:hypothetical protein